jgi:hypothetical protein
MWKYSALHTHTKASKPARVDGRTVSPFVLARQRQQQQQQQQRGQGGAGHGGGRERREREERERKGNDAEPSNRTHRHHAPPRHMLNTSGADEPFPIITTQQEDERLRGAER